MAVDPRVFALLEEMLDSGRSLEEVCRDVPELIQEVRKQWNSFCRIDAEFERLLPSSNGSSSTPAIHHPVKLPEIPGYRVDEVLGRGGMGVVYKAWHLRLNRPVAIKMLLSGPYASPQELERFLREAELVAALHHPNIVQVHDAGEVDGRPYFAMELVEGGDLGDQIQGVPQPSLKAAALMAPLAEAVHAAHQCGILHRDLKPGNILITVKGTPKVSDFGLARWLDGRDGLTFSATPVGTPSYMAPERAREDKLAIGPASDIYALGAILYELLTGRPPFRAENAAATLQQAISNEPVPPARLNPRVPRDLDTICLKCLHKEPHRRYASSAALAEDLRRFERGEPIKARPVGQIERAARWVRCRRALAGAMASGMLLAAALVVFVLWWFGQRMALEATAVAYAEADLNESERLREIGEFKTSAAVLQRAKDRLREFVPPELGGRLSTAFSNLELVTGLDAIRLERALVKPNALISGPPTMLGVLVIPGSKVASDSQALSAETLSGQRYQKAFVEAGIGAPDEDPAEVAARVRASPIRSALVAALDDWLACAVNREQEAWILAVIRRADPDSWRDRVRNPANWVDPTALRELSDQAPVALRSPQLLAVLGARLRLKKLDAVRFLERAVSAWPSDFWLNVEMANALLDQSRLAEAIGYYRTALALRPDTVSLRYALGDCYLGQQRWDAAISEYKQAGRVDPGNAWCHNRLGFTLAWKGGHDDEAIAEFAEAIRIDPNLGWSHYFLAIAFEHKGSLSEAVDEFQKAAQLLPEKRAEAKHRLRGLLVKLGRSADACAAWKQELAGNPPKHDDWFGYAELCLFLEHEEEYRSARRDLLSHFGSTKDPTIAERTGRACLLLPVEKDELQQSVALTERAVAAERRGQEFAYPYRLFAQGLARYREGQFDEAIKVMTGEAAPVMGPSPRLITSMALYQKGEHDKARETLAAAILTYDWSVSKAGNHDAWIAHILRREAESLIHPDQSTGHQGNTEVKQIKMNRDIVN